MNKLEDNTYTVFLQIPLPFVNSTTGPAEHITYNFLQALKGEKLRTNAGFGIHVVNHFYSWGIIVGGFILILLLTKLARMLKKHKKNFLNFRKLKKILISISCFILFIVASACILLPNLLGYPYSALLIWMPLTLPIFLIVVIMTCLVGILFLNRNSER